VNCKALADCLMDGYDDLELSMGHAREV
jgi:hypothetical protein